MYKITLNLTTCVNCDLEDCWELEKLGGDGDTKDTDQVVKRVQVRCVGRWYEMIAETFTLTIQLIF